MILESKKVPSKCKHARTTPIIGKPQPGPLLAISHAAPQAQCDVTGIVSSQGVSGLHQGLGVFWKNIDANSNEVVWADHPIFFTQLQECVIFTCFPSHVQAGLELWCSSAWSLCPLRQFPSEAWWFEYYQRTNTFLGISCVTLVIGTPLLVYIYRFI